ncbi:hypothetical protein KJ742_04025 [Patescibacteria group bacterium]|nr:hypothetical protein [Patescibacteria group bacterium]MBU1683089.1 hypothetical protein [Patescibacteria group bacterium]MBU1935150.1 hypothetical protein [Patescibacteria group bacterium]
MAKTSDDINVLKNLPEIKIWGEGLEDIYELKNYKGKFVITDDGKFIAKVLPRSDYNKAELFHDKILEELGVKNPTSAEMKKVVVGGGKIEIELIGDYVECRLYGVSQTYGSYDASDIDQAKMERAIEAALHLGMMPILVVPDFEKMTAQA